MRKSIYRYIPLTIVIFLFFCFSCTNEQTKNNSSDSVIETPIFKGGFCLNSKSTSSDENMVFTKDEIPYSLYCYLDYMVQTFIYHTDYSEVINEELLVEILNGDGLSKLSEESDEEFFNDSFFTNSKIEDEYVFDTNSKVKYEYVPMTKEEMENGKNNRDKIKYGFLFSKGLRDRNASFYFEKIDTFYEHIYDGHNFFHKKIGFRNFKNSVYSVKREWLISFRQEDLTYGFNIEELYTYDSVHIIKALKLVDSGYQSSAAERAGDTFGIKGLYNLIQELVLAETFVENVTVKVNYKILVMLFHELGHAYQYTHLRSIFNKFKDSPEKKYILELHADYIMGTFISRYIKAYITNKVASNKVTGIAFSDNFSIDFEGKLEVNKFHYKERLEKVNFHREFMNFGEIVFNEMLIKGDHDFGNSQHHGRNFERAKAFLDGYQDAYYSNNNFIVSHKKIEEKLIKKINNYEHIKNRVW